MACGCSLPDLLTCIVFACCLLPLPHSTMAVVCYVCPGNQLSNCAPSNNLTAKVTYAERNCTACGKLRVWNPKPPQKLTYVGLRGTVRNLEYKYCVESPQWTGCSRTDSAVTASIECVCAGDRCNSARSIDAIGGVSLMLLTAAAGGLLNAFRSF